MTQITEFNKRHWWVLKCPGKGFPYPNAHPNVLRGQIVGIPMGTNCAPLIADLFLYCYARDFMSDLSDFLSWISHGWVVTFQDSHRTVFTFRSWLDLLGVVLAFWISILKISKLLQNYWHRVIDITSFEKHLESSLDNTLSFCRNLVIFRSKNICQK